MQLLYTHIAGIPHRKPATLPPVGAHVLLVPEPTNAFDPHAIKVMYEGTHLGYIPAVETPTVRQFGWTEMIVMEVMPERKWKEVMIADIQAEDVFNPENHEFDPTGLNS